MDGPVGRALLPLAAVLLAACSAAGGPSSPAAPPVPALAATDNPTPSAAAPNERATVRYGSLGDQNAAPLWIGQARGYFEEQGLDVVHEVFRSAVDTIPLLATGKLDASNGGTGPAFFNALLAGADVKIVSNYSVLV